MSKSINDVRCNLGFNLTSWVIFRYITDNSHEITNMKYLKIKYILIFVKKRYIKTEILK